MGKLARLEELFAGRHFDLEVIILCVRWYFRFKLSLRDLVEMMAERGLSLAHTTILQRAQHYTPEFENAGIAMPLLSVNLGVLTKHTSGSKAKVASVAMAPAVQCVVSPGGSVSVRATTRCSTSVPSGGMRDGRVLSRSRPAPPAVMKRSCQRQSAVLLVLLRRMISAVPQPSAVSRTIRARQTCFCRLFRSATIAARC